MKIRNILIISLFALLVIPGCASGQKAKFGHADYNSIVQLLPGYDTIQTAAIALKTELETEYNAMAQELELKYTDYQQKAATFSPAVAKVKEQEILGLKERIEKFQEDAQLQIQKILYERSQPFMEKVKAAVEEVGKEGKYTYIFDASIPLFSAESADVSSLVKQKLGIQ